jgi:hypothetical protein
MAVDQAGSKIKTGAVDDYCALMSGCAAGCADFDDAAIVHSHQGIVHRRTSLGRHDRHMLDLQVCRQQDAWQGSRKHQALDTG